MSLYRREIILTRKRNVTYNAPLSPKDQEFIDFLRRRDGRMIREALKGWRESR